MSIEQWLMTIGALSAVFTYLDATSHKIGKIKGDKSFFNMAAATWAVCCFMLSIVAFSLYLYKREALKEKAKVQPVDVSFIQRLVITLLLCWLAFCELYQWGVITPSGLRAASYGLPSASSVVSNVPDTSSSSSADKDPLESNHYFIEACSKALQEVRQTGMNEQMMNCNGYFDSTVLHYSVPMSRLQGKELAYLIMNFLIFDMKDQNRASVTSDEIYKFLGTYENNMDEVLTKPIE